MKLVRGVILPSPLPKPALGTRFEFQSVLAPSGHEAGNFTLEAADTFDGAVLSIHFMDTERHTIEGSAIMVAPGVAVTATHVLSDRRANVEAGLDKLGAFAVSKAGLGFWQPRTVFEVGGTDLSLLALEFASPLSKENTFKHAALTTRLPELGEPITIVGFRTREAEYPVEEGRARFDGEMLMGVGEVMAVYPEFRDRVMAPFPMIEVGCGAIGGMSGGPAFDKFGRLVGVLSSSLATDDGQGPANVSLIYPAIGRKFRPAWLPEYLGEETSLLHLSHPMCDIDRRDAVTVVHATDGNSYTTSYDHWS